MSLTAAVMCFLLGMAVGIPALSQIVSSLFIVLPNYRRLKEVTTLEHPFLLYILYRGPLIWATGLVFACSVVLVFLPEYDAPYLVGVFVALVTSLIEVSHGKNVEEYLPDGPILEAWRRSEQKDLSGYPAYTDLQMKMAGWHVNDINVAPYRDLPWECAMCGATNHLERESVLLQGIGNRYILKCDRCRMPTIVRVRGLFRCRILTEGRVPAYAPVHTAERPPPAKTNASGPKGRAQSAPRQLESHGPARRGPVSPRGAREWSRPARTGLSGRTISARAPRSRDGRVRRPARPGEARRG